MSLIAVLSTLTVALGPTDGTTGNPGVAGDVSAYYLDVGSPPWDVTDYAEAMDDVFGAGNWTEASFIDNVPNILADATFIYLEGSDDGAEDLKAWLSLYGDQLVTWVGSGGDLYINCAPNEGGNFDLPFDITLSYPEFSNEGNASAAHPIYSGPFTPIITNYTGDPFSHATLSGNANSLMTNVVGDDVIVEVGGNGGRIVYSGIVAPSLQDQDPESGNLLRNIIAYTAFGPMIDLGSNFYYVSTATSPWDSDDYADAMDAVFGAGNWSAATFADDTLEVLNDAAFLYVEGSDESATEMADWLAANAVVIEAWVESGGNLLINAAPNEGDNIDLPFGVEADYPELSFEASAIDTHPIFEGPFTPIATEFIGNAFAHATILGASTGIMQNEDGDVILGEGAPIATAGTIVYGTLSAPQFHLPQPDSQNLLQNMIAYVAGDIDVGCYADCDGDGELTILDFVCYQNAFASGDPDADCDGSGVLDILDFVCFQNEFSAGCD